MTGWEMLMNNALRLALQYVPAHVWEGVKDNVEIIAKKVTHYDERLLRAELMLGAICDHFGINPHPSMNGEYHAANPASQNGQKLLGANASTRVE